MMIKARGLQEIFETTKLEEGFSQGKGPSDSHFHNEKPITGACGTSVD